MKNFILALLVIVTSLATSCKKHEIVEPNDPPIVIQKAKQKVTFKMSSAVKANQSYYTKATEATGGTFISIDSLKKLVKTLDFIVFDSTGRRVSNASAYRKDSGTDFGTYTDSLKSGKYTVVVVGSTNDDQYILDLNEHLDEYWLRWRTYGISQQLFMKVDTMQVVNTPVTKTLALEKVTGDIDLVVNEVIPAGVEYIELNFNSYGVLAPVSKPASWLGSTGQLYYKWMMPNLLEKPNAMLNITMLAQSTTNHPTLTAMYYYSGRYYKSITEDVRVTWGEHRSITLAPFVKQPAP